MPKIASLSDYFSKLEEIPVSEIQQWSAQPEDLLILENRVGNKMLYPQAVPQTPRDLAFDLIIIRKVIELNQTNFYNKNLKRIDIPEEFLQYFPETQKLVSAFIDAIMPSGITTFWMISKTLGRKNLGTLVRPEMLHQGDEIAIGVLDRKYQIKVGCLAIIPIVQSRADMTFTSATATLMGKKIVSIQIVAGQMGLIVDTRIK